MAATRPRRKRAARDKAPKRTPWSGPHFPKGKNGWCDDARCVACNSKPPFRTTTR